MKSVKFECEDRYEAEKLASLVAVQKNQTVYMDGVAAVIGNEIVIKLKDKSSHSVLLKDKENVERLLSLLLDVLEGKEKIQSSDFSGSIAEIMLA
ncbi:MAG TPA: hypothetical protein VNI77_12055 [Nitrososphaera sp.]|nr:hypothetical protein [Nitrososphaera sp.]